MDLQSVVDIMLAGDPSLGDHFLFTSSTLDDSAANGHTVVAELPALVPPSTPSPPLPPTTEGSEELFYFSEHAPAEQPSLEVLRRLRLQRFCPSEAPPAAETVPSTGLVCEETMEDSLPPLETTASASSPLQGATSSNSPTSPSDVRSFPFLPSSSSSSSFIPLPQLPASHSTSSSSTNEVLVFSPGYTASPISSTTTSSSSSASSPAAGASSLLMKSALPETAYIPLSEINSTKLAYLVDRLQKVRTAFTYTSLAVAWN